MNWSDAPYAFLGDSPYRLAEWYPSQLPPDVDEFVREHGRSQSGRPVPVGWGRRRLRTPHRCYEAAGRDYLGTGCAYTEGRALAHGTWRPHAWLTDSGGEVIDLAFDEPGLEYVGVEIPDEVADRAFVSLGIYSPILPVVLRAFAWMPDA